MFFSNDYDLDGIDFDWEGQQTKEQRVAYYRLIRDTSLLLKHNNEQQQIQQPRSRLVSLALHPNMLVPRKLYQYLDRVHLMTYDMVRSSNQYHATVQNTRKAVSALLRHDCPPEKLVVGIPLYARHGQNPGQVKTVAEIVDETSAAVVLEKSSHNGYLFESQESLRSKLDLVREEGLGGVFFWEIGQDKQDENTAPGGVILQTVHDAVAVADADTEMQSSSPDDNDNDEL